MSNDANEILSPYKQRSEICQLLIVKCIRHCVGLCVLHVCSVVSMCLIFRVEIH